MRTVNNNVTTLDQDLTSADLCILHGSRITDQKRRTYNDLFIDHYSLVIERRVVPLCRRGENRFLFIAHRSLVIERSTDNTGSVVDVVANGGGNAILDHIVYDSFGNTVSQTNSADTMLMGFDGFYEVFDPERARRLVGRLEFRHTPKHGSWLNIAENELSSLTRQCVAGRRFGDIETLRQETAAW